MAYFKKFFVFNIIIFLSLTIFAQKQSDLETLIANEAIILSDNTSFEFLDSILINKKVVILGEALHEDGETFYIKSKMVEYLAKKHGYNTLMIEAFPLNCVNRGDCYIFPSKYSQSLTKALLEGSLRMNYMGIESSYSGFNDVMQFLKKHGLEKESIALNEEFKKCIYDELLDSTGIVKSNCISSVQKLMKLIGLAKKYLNLTLKNKDKTHSSIDENTLRYMFHLLNGIKEILSEDLLYNRETIISKGSKMNYNDLREWTNLRDKHMGMNVVHYMQTHPKSKIIIWCASFHGAKDISQVKNLDYPILYAQTKTMGEYIAEELGDALYSIAFTSYNKNPKKCGSLEKKLAQMGLKWGFLDFESLRLRKSFLNDYFNCNAIMKKDGCWMNVWDGLYFIRNQKTNEVFPNWLEIINAYRKTNLKNKFDEIKVDEE